MLPLLTAALFVWGLDRSAKTLALRRVGLGATRRYGPLMVRPMLHRPFRDRPVRPGRLMIGWLLAALAAVSLVSTGSFFVTIGSQIALGAALGGAAGNLQDLWRRGSVVDFLDLGLGVFNLADVAIVGGLATAILWTLLEGRFLS